MKRTGLICMVRGAVMGLVTSLLGMVSACRSGAQLRAGEPLPAFRASAHDGSEVTPARFAGKWLVLWFYPKADTSG